MVEREDKIISLLKDFVERLREIKDIYAVVLFGSHSLGSANPNSDIDVAVFTNEVVNDYFKEIKEIYKLRRSISTDIEPIIYNRDDFFNHSESDLVHQIIKKGKLIYKEGRFLV